MNMDLIPTGIAPPDDVIVVIEIPVGGEPIKYEMDKATDTLVVDRFLYMPRRYPGNYGFVQHTLSDAGDPIDVLVANSRQIIPGAVINVRSIGVHKLEDDDGAEEEIVVVPSGRPTQRYVNIHNYSDLPEITCRLIGHVSAVQGSRAEQIGEADGLGRLRRSAPLDHGGDRSLQTIRLSVPARENDLGTGD